MFRTCNIENGNLSCKSETFPFLSCKSETFPFSILQVRKISVFYLASPKMLVCCSCMSGFCFGFFPNGVGFFTAFARSWHEKCLAVAWFLFWILQVALRSSVEFCRGLSALSWGADSGFFSDLQCKYFLPVVAAPKAWNRPLSTGSSDP